LHGIGTELLLHRSYLLSLSTLSQPAAAATARATIATFNAHGDYHDSPSHRRVLHFHILGVVRTVSVDIRSDRRVDDADEFPRLQHGKPLAGP